MLGWQFFFALFGVVVVVIIVVMYFLAAYVAKPNYHTVTEITQELRENGFWRDYDSMAKEELRISSCDGYILHATYIPAKDPVLDRYVIISHGYTCNRFSSVRYVHLFHKLGYHCMIYDNRSHGNNRKGICTLGKRENADLTAMIRYMKKRFGKDIKLGLHGESMGSALQTLALHDKPKVDFLIDDCGFARLMDVLMNNIGNSLHLPRWLCYPASAASKCFFGFSYTGTRPIDELKNNEIPICFIHGEADTFIPCEQSKMMYEATKGYRELHLFPGAEHALSINTDEARYEQVVREFLAHVYPEEM